MQEQMGYSVGLNGISTLVEGLQWRAHDQPQRLAYTFLRQSDGDPQSLTYEQLAQQARALAVLLQSKDATGKPVLLLLQPGLDYVVAFFGCLYAGAIAVPAYPPFSQRMVPRIEAMLQDSQAPIVITTSDTIISIQRCLVHIPQLDRLEWIVIDTVTPDLAENWHQPAISGESIAFLQYTSGSTANPKGVMVLHRNILQNVELLRVHCGQTSESSLVSWVPPYHDLGLIAGILFPFYTGFPAYLMSPVAFLQRPLRWLQALSDTRATMTIAPNFAYELCAKKITEEQKARLDLSHLEIAGNGGEPLRAATLKLFSEVFASCGFRAEAFFPGYGMAESTLIIATGQKMQHTVVRSFQKAALEQQTALPVVPHDQDAYAIVGYDHLAANHTFKIVDPDTCLCRADNQVGEIWVRGPVVTAGYWKNEEETHKTFCGFIQDTGEGPFLRTGDLGFIDQGELFITGRLKDLIIIRGNNYYPQDIEYTAEQSHEAIRPGCSAAFSVDVQGYEQLVILLEIDPHYQPSSHEGAVKTEGIRKSVEALEIIEAIRQAVSKQHELTAWQVVLLKAGTIQKTSSGKIQRRACRMAFLQKTLQTWGSERNEYK